MFIYFLLLVSFLDTMAQLPILVLYINYLQATALMTGIVLASYSLTNLIANIFNGYITDIYGRKTAIVSGMLIAGVAVIFYGLINTPEQLLIVRIIHGLGGGILVPAVFALIGDIHKQGSVGKSMGFSGAAVGLAALLGPMLAGISKDLLGFETFFILLGSLLVITALFTIVLLPSKFTKHQKQPLTLTIIKNLIIDAKLQTAYLAAFGVTFALGTLAYELPLQLKILGFTTKDVGFLMSLFSLTAIVVFITPLNRLSDRWGREVPIIIGYILLIFSFITLLIAQSYLLLVLSMLLFGSGFGLIFPAMNAIIVDNSNPDYRGSAFGVFYAVFSLGIVAGQFLSGLAIQFNLTPFLITLGINIILLGVLYLKKSRNSIS